MSKRMPRSTAEGCTCERSRRSFVQRSASSSSWCLGFVVMNWWNDYQSAAKSKPSTPAVPLRRTASTRAVVHRSRASAVVKIDGVNFRTKPSSSAKLIRGLKEGREGDHRSPRTVSGTRSRTPRARPAGSPPPAATSCSRSSRRRVVRMIGNADEFWRVRVTRVDTTDGFEFEWHDDILYRDAAGGPRRRGRVLPRRGGASRRSGRGRACGDVRQSR